MEGGGKDEKEEIEKVYNTCPGYLKSIVAVAICTGMRKEEILRLKWLDIDDLPPLAVPLVKLESMELWSREQVPGNLRHCVALLDCTLSATLQSIYLLQSM